MYIKICIYIYIIQIHRVQNLSISSFLTKWPRVPEGAQILGGVTSNDVMFDHGKVITLWKPKNNYDH